MKNYLLLISLFIFCIQFSFGQVETEVIWQPVQQVSKGIILSDIIGTDESGIYVLKRQSETYSLEHLNHKLVKTKTENILKSKAGTNEYEGITHIGSKIFLLSSQINRKLKKRFLYAQLIDKKTLQASGERRVIAEYNMSPKKATTTGAYRDRNIGEFYIQSSKDKSKLLVHAHLPEAAKKDPDVRLALFVFDSDLNKIWDKNVTVPYKEELFIPYAFRVNNQGDVVYMIGKKKSKKKNLIIGYSFNDFTNSYSDDLSLFRYSDEDSKEYTISQDEYFVPEVQLAFEENGDLVCAGFYSDAKLKSIKTQRYETIPNPLEISKGIFLLRINSETGEVKDKSFDKFSDDLTMKDTNRNITRKDLPKPIRYEMKNVIVRKNGELLLVGELTHKYLVESPNNLSRTVNMRDDILVFSINGRNIEWSRKIPKRQITTGMISMGLSSFSTFENKEKLHFIFNEHENSLDHDDKRTLKKLLGSEEEYVASVAEIDSEGNTQRNKLFSVKNKEVLFRTYLSTQVSDNEVIFVGKKDKKYRVAKIIFK